MTEKFKIIDFTLVLVLRRYNRREHVYGVTKFRHNFKTKTKTKTETKIFENIKTKLKLKLKLFAKRKLNRN
jgi:hypothetical protein